MIDQRGTSIEYQAKTKHLDLMYLISQTRNRSAREKYTRQATAIRYYIRALRFKDYLTDKQVNQIYQCLVSIADLYEFPVNPNLPTVEPPQQGTTTIIVGTKGDTGDDGGGTDYSALNIVTDTTVDEFPTSIAYAAEWSYDISDSSGNGRSGRISAKWNTTAGTISAAVEYGSPDLGVDTSPVTFQTAIVSGNVRLIALVASGTWTIRGTRYLTPNGGVLQVTPSVLASGNILVGNASNAAVSVALSGDGTISNTGVFAIGTGVIVNADINTSAAIAWSKLAAGTTSRVIVTNASTGLLEVSPITTTLLGYLSNVTSDIQAQIDALSTGTFNGAVSTILTLNLTTDKVLISNPAGKVAVSGVSVTNLNTLDTTTSLTTQLTTKLTDPTTTVGDIVIRNVSNNLDRLGTSTVGQVLTVGSNNVPTWQTPVGGDVSARITENLITDIMSLQLKEIIASNETKSFVTGAEGARIYVINFAASSALAEVTTTIGGDSYPILDGGGAADPQKNWVNTTDMPGLPTEVSSGAIAGAAFIPVGAGVTVEITSPNSLTQVRVVYVDLE